ncbi:MAG: Sec-independent protein translocase protein TatA [Ilumatobacteraceae bacterium]|nr:Sec-independent protein translocase protein TatA [Ilumatobacteraceae bacterium]
MPGPPELLILLVIVLLVFGGSKLPKLARSLGEAQTEFKKATDTATTDVPSPLAPPAAPTHRVDEVKAP